MGVCYFLSVAPFEGAWIEIVIVLVGKIADKVAPFAGAWIEIVEITDEYSEKAVAPFAGARIEKNNELLRNHKQRVEVPFL